MGNRRVELRAKTAEADPRKAIAAGRDRIQSELLAGAVGALLMAKAVAIVLALGRLGSYPHWFWVACGVSAGFALLVWLLRSATAPAAAMGGFVCLNILLGQDHGLRWQQTAMPALVTLFVLTFAATRFGRRRKEAAEIASKMVAPFQRIAWSSPVRLSGVERVRRRPRSVRVQR